MSKLAVTGVVVGGLMVIGMVAGDGDAAGDEYGAKDACKEWVKDQLKAPTTAKFSEVEAQENGTDKWIVTGSVASQNGFGAMLSTGWICDVRAEGDVFRGSASLLEF